MSNGELILDKINLIMETINEHMNNCPDCHLKTILQKIIGEGIN